MHGSITLFLILDHSIKEEPCSSFGKSFNSKPTLPESRSASAGDFGLYGKYHMGGRDRFFPSLCLESRGDQSRIFFAVYASVLILCRLLGGRILDVYRREKIIFPCLFLIIIAMTILASSTTSTMFLLVAVIWGLGNSFFFPSIVAYAIDLARSSYGPAIGTYLALSDLGTSIGSVIMGIVLQWSNYQIMFLSLAFIGFLNLCFFYFTFRKKGVDHHAHL
jgi:MFS family permease